VQVKPQSMHSLNQHFLGFAGGIHLSFNIG